MTRSRSSSYAWALVLAGVAIGCGGGGGDGPGIVNAPVVVSVTVGEPGANPIDIGQTVQLAVDVQVQNGASQAVEWSSSAPNVASVSTTGLVTGVAAGQATITATSTANRTKTGSANMTVNAPRVVSVALNGGNRTIRTGENFALQATVDTRGTIAKTVSFTTSDPAVATVSSSDGLTATVTGVGAGQANITAASTADGTKNAAIAVTVTGSVRITNVTPSPATVRPGTTVKLVPTVQADPGVSPAVTFTSQNTAIATVAGDGTVTGVAVGNTGIIVRSVADQAVSVTVPVTVRSGVTSVSLTPDRDTVRQNGTRQLTLSVVTDAGVSNAVTLSSANSAIATVDAQARVTGVGVGQTYVRAISTVDPTVGDSTLMTVVDPCAFTLPFQFGTNISGAVTAASCNGVTEFYEHRVTTQSTYAIGATVQFPANFSFINDKSGGYFFALGAGQSATGFVVAAPGHYYVAVTATNASQRGTFSLVGQTNPALTSTCGVVATTGVTVQVPMNACNFQPQGKPVATYYSFGFGLLPFIQAGQQVTISITTPAPIVPYVELKWSTSSTIIVATGTNQSLVQTFTAPAGGGFGSFTISSRDANQNGNVNVKIEGPPSISFDASVFGSGMLGSRTSAPALWPPDRRLVAYRFQQPVRR